MKIKRLSMAIVAVLMLSAILGAQFVAATSASETASTSQTTHDYYNNAGYTEIIGTMGGANFVIRIPDIWNGMLVVGCRGYSHVFYPNSQFDLDGICFPLISGGFAYASSSYGEGGYCIQKAVIRIHQLTEYVVDNYNVLGKVFLIGTSMGGNVALLLGEKYPDLYSGVLDICGVKDLKSLYEGAQYVLSLTDEQISALLGIPIWAVPAYRAFVEDWLADVQIECGGALEDKPKAYERISPTYHADITKPVISVIGGMDYVVPPEQTEMYQDAVALAGSSDLYRVYTVPLGGHCDLPVILEALSRFGELVLWSFIIGDSVTCTVVA